MKLLASSLLYQHPINAARDDPTDLLWFYHLPRETRMNYLGDEDQVR
jgi:hypothetical protein